MDHKSQVNLVPGNPNARAPLPAIADRTSKILSRFKTSALVLSGIRPHIKHSHKTLGLRARVLCSCLMLGIIPDKTAASGF